MKMKSPAPCDNEKHIGFEICTLAHVIKRNIDNMQSRKFAEKLTGMHGWIIGFLYDNSERDIYQRDLEEMLNIRRSSVSSLLGIMENNGLIKRESVEHDARLKKIVLTEKAIKLQEKIRQDIKQLENTIKSDISDEEIESFMKTAEKIKKNLEQEAK